MNPKKPRMNCLNCGKECKRPESIYCNNKCQQQYIAKKYIEEWLQGYVKGYTTKLLQPSRYIIRYLRNKYDNKCQKCGWGEVNIHTNIVPLEIHHIDGSRINCSPDNLELICPNCHSLTENFRARNKK